VSPTLIVPDIVIYSLCFGFGSWGLAGLMMAYAKWQEGQYWKRDEDDDGGDDDDDDDEDPSPRDGPNWWKHVR